MGTWKEYYQKYYQRNKEAMSKQMVAWQRAHPLETMLYAARSRAKVKGYECTIEISDLVVPDVCPYLGQQLEFKNTRHDYTPSLDRIDSSKGYVKGNVEIISLLANRMKNSASHDTLMKFCQAYLERNKT